MLSSNPSQIPAMSPVPFYLYDYVFGVTSFVLGAIVGSFLNVCVYRLPLGMSVNEPRRSFCPQCKAQLAWHENIPILGWLALRGRCAHCKAPIAVRYPLVELLTALLFFFVWHRFREEWMLVLPYWVFTALIIVATFIDFDHFIIPDEITVGGTVAGVLLSVAVPALMGEESNVIAPLWSLLGAGVGYCTLWAVVEGGKIAFGKKRVLLPKVEDFVWRPGNDKEEAALVIGGEVDLWSEFFSREKDELVLHCDALALAGKEHGAAVLHCFYNRVELDGSAYPLDGLGTFSGRLREFVFPREAMGFGDVKFIACIGAFLGWKAVFFTIAAASMVGSVVGVALLLPGPKARSLKIPFGPYLSLGAMTWMFVGPQVVRWYLGLMGH